MAARAPSRCAFHSIAMWMRCIAGGVVVEEPFLERRRLHLSVFGQQQRRLGKAVRLARRVQAEYVGLMLVEADDVVVDRRGDREQEADDRERSAACRRDRRSSRTPHRSPLLSAVEQHNSRARRRSPINSSQHDQDRDGVTPARSGRSRGPSLRARHRARALKQRVGRARCASYPRKPETLAVTRFDCRETSNTIDVIRRHAVGLRHRAGCRS